MTAVVGILCSDGVVVGTDSSATFASSAMPTMEQPTDKLVIIEDQIIIAGTGDVGLGQRFARKVERHWKAGEFKKADDEYEATQALCRIALDDFALTRVLPNTLDPRHQGLRYGALVAFPLKQKPYLCEFAEMTFQPELKTDKLWYASMGSAQHITDPFLGFVRDTFWEDKVPKLGDGVLAVTWALDHAIRVNPGGVGGPIAIAFLRTDGKGRCSAQRLDPDALALHRGMIRDIQNAMRAVQSEHRSNDLLVRDIPNP